jgi:hypothetical protein
MSLIRGRDADIQQVTHGSDCAAWLVTYPLHRGHEWVACWADPVEDALKATASNLSADCAVALNEAIAAAIAWLSSKRQEAFIHVNDGDPL